MTPSRYDAAPPPNFDGSKKPQSGFCAQKMLRIPNGCSTCDFLRTLTRCCRFPPTLRLSDRSSGGNKHERCQAQQDVLSSDRKADESFRLGRQKAKRHASGEGNLGDAINWLVVLTGSSLWHCVEHVCSDHDGGAPIRTKRPRPCLKSRESLLLCSPVSLGTEPASESHIAWFWVRRWSR